MSSWSLHGPAAIFAMLLVSAQGLLGCGPAQARGCVTQTHSLESPEQKSTSGFSVNDALGDSTGACYSLTWLPTSAQATYTPADNTTSLRLRLGYVNGAIVDRSILSDSTAHDPGGSDGCIPTVSTKLSINLVSADGALDEYGLAEFTGYGKERADFTWASDASKLRGTFKLVDLHPGSGVSTANPTLSFVGAITPESESGSLVLSTGSTDSGGKSGSGLALVIAQWQRVACPPTPTTTRSRSDPTAVAAPGTASQLPGSGT